MSDRRRFLITLGVDHYRDGCIPDLAEAAKDAGRIRDLLVPMGYRVAMPDLVSVSVRDIPMEIDRWAVHQELDANDVVVVYFAGHGAKGIDGRHYLMVADTVPELWSTALATEDFTRPLMHSKLGNLLVVLDTAMRRPVATTPRYWPPN